MSVQYEQDLFQPIDREEVAEAEKNTRPSLTYWQDAWRRLRSNKVAITAFVGIILITLIAIVGPMLVRYGYGDQIKGQENLWPSLQHPFGTDSLGRDLFSRVLVGTRISLSVGIAATIITLTIGVFYGGISGYFGGKVDNIMMRIVDIIYSLPFMLIVILLSVFLKDIVKSWFDLPILSVLQDAGPGLVSTYIAIGLTYWVDMARIVRGQILSLKEQEYVTAAKTLGASNFRILIRHLIPNCLGVIIVTATLQIPSAIFTEAFLSFISLGVDPPMPSLGGLASDALEYIRSQPYQLFIPAAAISITILAFNLFGDGLRDALDPRMRK